MIAKLFDNKIAVLKCYQIKDYIKALGGQWNRAKQAWILPLDKYTVQHLRQLSVKISQEVLDKLLEMEQMQKRLDQLKDQENSEPLKPVPLTIPLYSHQIRAYNLGITCNSVALLMEMGTGKSLASVAIASRRYLDGEIKKLLIVAPKAVCPVWPMEFKHSTVMHRILVLDGTLEQRSQAIKDSEKYSEGLNILVVNYEAVWRLFDKLKKWNPCMIIADESQRIKNHTAKQSKAMHKLGDIAKYKLILTGTPVQNAPLDFFSQYKFLNNAIFGTSYWAFRDRYAVLGGYAGKQVVSYKNLGDLAQKAHSIAYRITKQEAIDLPDQVDQMLYCSLEPSTMALLTKIKRESYAELEQGNEITAQNVLTKILRLQQIVGGFVTDEEGVTEQVSTAKLNILREILEDILTTDKKVVIFARFTKEIEAIQKVVNNLNIRYCMLTGQTKNRGEEVDKFQNNPTYKVFIAQIQAAGIGITLHAADTMIFYSLSWNYADYCQARARIHRIGQTNKCTYIHLIAKGTIDEEIMTALRNKENMANLVVDNWKKLLS